MTTIVITYHSGYHHTEAVALEVARGAEAAGATVIVHNVENPVERIWTDIASADAVIFGTPTYMGSVSGPFKMFMDSTVKIWASQQWKDKIAAGFTNSAGLSGDKLNTLQTLSVFAMQHGMVWVGTGILPKTQDADGHDLNRLGSWLGLMTQSDDAPADQTPPKADRMAARAFGQRVAEAAVRWGKNAA